MCDAASSGRHGAIQCSSWCCWVGSGPKFSVMSMVVTVVRNVVHSVRAHTLCTACSISVHSSGSLAHTHNNSNREENNGTRAKLSPCAHVLIIIWVWPLSLFGFSTMRLFYICKQPTIVYNCQPKKACQSLCAHINTPALLLRIPSHNYHNHAQSRILSIATWPHTAAPERPHSQVDRRRRGSCSCSSDSKPWTRGQPQHTCSSRNAVS